MADLAGGSVPPVISVGVAVAQSLATSIIRIIDSISASGSIGLYYIRALFLWSGDITSQFEQCCSVGRN